MKSPEEIEEWLRARTAQAAHLPAEKVRADQSFARLGLDSMSMLTITGELASLLQRDLPSVLLWKYETPAKLAAHLAQHLAASEAPAAPAVSREAPMPLSHAQEYLWRICLPLPDQSSQMRSLRYRLKGSLNAAALRSTFNELARRHEMLRTSFSIDPGQPLQIVHPVGPVLFVEEDLSALPEAEERAEAVAKEAARKPIFLDRGPLWHVLLLKLSEGEHRLVVHLHHLLYDFPALLNFYRETRILYTAFSNGEPSPLPELAVQMADYASLDRGQWRPESAPYREALAWWLDYWAEAPPPWPSFSFWRKRPVPDADARESAFSLPVPTPALRPLLALAQAEQTTLHVVLLAALGLVLFEDSGERQIAIGIYTSNRPGRGTKDLIGYFLNQMLLRVDGRGAVTFREFLRRLRVSAAGAAAHQELPVGYLVEELRRAGRPILGAALYFQYLRDDQDHFRLQGVEVTRWPEVDAAAQMPEGFTISVLDRLGNLRVSAKADLRRFDPARTLRMLQRYIEVIEQLAKNPDLPLPAPLSGWKRFLRRPLQTVRAEGGRWRKALRGAAG